jgi:hypothetical protein
VSAWRIRIAECLRPEVHCPRRNLDQAHGRHFQQCFDDGHAKLLLQIMVATRADGLDANGDLTVVEKSKCLAI